MTPTSPQPDIAPTPSNPGTDPNRPQWLVGVTGTNGKTTTASLIGRLLASAGWRVATVQTVIDSQPHAAPELNAVLRAASGCRGVVQETTQVPHAFLKSA